MAKYVEITKAVAREMYECDYTIVLSLSQLSPDSVAATRINRLEYRFTGESFDTIISDYRSGSLYGAHGAKVKFYVKPNELEEHKADMQEWSYKRTTYEPDPYSPKERCLIVYPDNEDKGFYFRFAPLYRMYSKTKVLVTKFCDNEWCAETELNILWDELKPKQAYFFTKRDIF